LITDAVSGLYDRGKEEMEAIGVRLMTAGDLARAIDEQEVRDRPILLKGPEA